MYRFIKRTIDIVLSLILLIPLAVVMLLIAILIKLGDKGPVFYAGERLGKDCKVFKMYKFRTMIQNAPDIRNADFSTYNSKKDPRVTKIGRVLRETSLDELPQILNVLKGEMSFIGPRAGLPDVLDTYQPDELDKMKVKPGISGYTQAYYRNSITNREKRLYDAWYANHISFVLDVKVFFMTFKTVLSRKGIYTNTEKQETTLEK